jgi:glycosyltransferase involved in cell wall biosynthesis
MKKNLCAILCYNNKKTILRIIEEQKKLKKDFDVIFINDGSSDNTIEILQSLKSKVINHKKNLGYGQAVKSAFKYARKKRYNFLAIFPADNQRYTDDLIKMKKIIEKYSFDLILGSKFEILKKIPLHRKLGNLFFSLTAKIFWNCRIKDVLSGFKIYKINSFYKYINLLPNDYSFDIVLSQIVSFKKMKFKELSVKCRYNQNTTSMENFYKFNKKNIIFIAIMMLLNIIKFFFKYKLRIN